MYCRRVLGLVHSYEIMFGRAICVGSYDKRVLEWANLFLATLIWMHKLSEIDSYIVYPLE